MVDRQVRDILAEAIRHFVARLSGNYEFDDAAFSVRTEDRRVRIIREQIWGIYDNPHEHKLDDDWALSDEQGEIVHRVIMFLKSDAEYRWPKVPAWYRLAHPVIWALSLATLMSRLDAYYSRKFDLTVWPFRTLDEIERVRREPKYLARAA